MKKTESITTSTDTRFAETLGGSEYEDLLIALEYYDDFQAETGAALRRYVQKHCQHLGSIRVLEAGPGTGITTLELLKADPRVHVTSVDNEPKMLKAVEDRFTNLAEQKDRVEFVLADILQYLESCDDDSLDAFASVFTLHNFAPAFRSSVISLIAQKLKQGGAFINGDKYAQRDDLHQIDFASEIRNYGKFEVAAKAADEAGDTSRAAHLRQVHAEWVHHADEDEVNKITVDETHA